MFYTETLEHRFKHVLAVMVYKNPDTAIGLFGTSSTADEYLRRMWGHLAQDYESDTEYPFPGFAFWHRPAGEGRLEAVVIVLPKPQNRGEAWFIGIFRTPDSGHRVFALERGADPLTGEPIAMLAETDAEGRANWGSVDQHWLEVFVARVDQILNDPEAAPLTYSPTPSMGNEG